MSQPVQPITLQVTPTFNSQVPALPDTKQERALAPLATSPDPAQQLVCKDLLQGETLARAQREAVDEMPKIYANREVFAVFGNDALDAVNDLNDQMLRQHPPMDIPELREVMRGLSRQMRGMGRKYDPTDPHVLEKYEKVKGGIRAKWHLGKTFLEEFLDDISSLQQQFDRVIKVLEGRQYQLLKNVAYYDEFYGLNEQEIDKIIYKIGVMELIRDLAAQKAQSIVIGATNLGDRGAEQQADLLEFVQLLENKIIAFKSRLWVAWAMAPQIRTMRTLSLGLSARIDQTIDITIPTMKGTIVAWLTLSDAQQAEQFNKAAEDAFNESMVQFANATKAIVPALANALATPALDPRTVVAWSESLAAQADGIIQAIEEGQQKRAELEQAMVQGKGVIDNATMRVNQALLKHALEAAENAAPLDVAHSVPALPAPAPVQS